jgi:hypothetical protein
MTDRRDGRARAVELVCAWAGIVGLVGALAGMLLARMLPIAPAPTDSAAEVVDYYTSNLHSIRLGLAILSVAVCSIGPLIALTTVKMLRMGLGGSPILPILQAVTGAVTYVMLMVPMIVLNVAAFRPGRDPEITQALHDLGWLLFLTPVAPFVIQNLAIAAAILSDDRPIPVLPRWLGYFNIWVGLLFLPALGAYFLKDGPLAWNGVLVFYLATVVYGAWMVAMALELRKSVLRHHDSPADEVVALPEPAGAR